LSGKNVFPNAGARGRWWRASTRARGATSAAPRVKCATIRQTAHSRKRVSNPVKGDFFLSVIYALWVINFIATRNFLCRLYQILFLALFCLIHSRISVLFPPLSQNTVLGFGNCPDASIGARLYFSFFQCVCELRMSSPPNVLLFLIDNFYNDSVTFPFHTSICKKLCGHPFAKEISFFGLHKENRIFKGKKEDIVEDRKMTCTQGRLDYD
jgi:hypothetical protein